MSEKTNKRSTISCLDPLRCWRCTIIPISRSVQLAFKVVQSSSTKSQWHTSRKMAQQNNQVVWLALLLTQPNKKMCLIWQITIRCIYSRPIMSGTLTGPAPLTDQFRHLQFAHKVFSVCSCSTALLWHHLPNPWQPLISVKPHFSEPQENKGGGQ